MSCKGLSFVEIPFPLANESNRPCRGNGGPPELAIPGSTCSTPWAGVAVTTFRSCTKVKLKYLRGAFSWSQSHWWPDFPWPWSRALAQGTYPFCGSAILLASAIICFRCARFNLRTFSCFCTFDHSQITRRAYHAIVACDLLIKLVNWNGIFNTF